MAETRVDIGVCTFRRPALAETLHSLATLSVPDGVLVGIIVADNDEQPGAEALVRQIAAGTPHEILYRHAPARNISIARNVCLDAAEGDFLAFIDDDETASPGWLAALLETAVRERADAVLGPVRALYGETAPGWMRAGDFHSTLPVHVGGAIRTGYTCNVLLRLASPAVAGRRFELSLGRTGGEDTAYFTGLHRDGGLIAHAPDALVYEPVPAGRARLSWLAKRRFRMGQTHGRIVIGQRPAGARIGQIGLAAAKAGYCLTAAAGMVFSPGRRNRHALRGIMHAGVVVGLLGVREIEQYGVAEGGARAA